MIDAMHLAVAQRAELVHQEAAVVLRARHHRPGALELAYRGRGDIDVFRVRREAVRNAAKLVREHRHHGGCGGEVRVEMVCRLVPQDVGEVRRLEEILQGGEATLADRPLRHLEEHMQVSAGLPAEPAKIRNCRLLPVLPQGEVGHFGSNLRDLGVGRPGVGLLGREDADRHPAPLEGDDFVENERLRKPRPRLDQIGDRTLTTHRIRVRP